MTQGPRRKGAPKGWLTPVNVAIAVAVALALGLRLLLLSRPGYLMGVTEYDDGPYFGSAVDLLHGVLPYRDFIFVQPPGITLLMLPAAALSRLYCHGHRDGGLAATTAASVAAVAGVGLLARHRGLLAVIVSCGLMAVYPDSVLTSRTVLVEPWLTVFCLAGALAVAEGDRLTASRRVAGLAGGAAFGFAGAVEVWAIFPVLVLFLLLLPGIRRAALFAAGVAAGFAVPVLPFAAVDPRRFYQSLYVAQVAPRAG